MQAKLASVTCPLNSLQLPFQLIKWTSPVVKKQHFEVVFYPPAASTMCRRFNPGMFKTKKTLAEECFLSLMVARDGIGL
ncbi:MAG: hypothetical protein J6039_04330, partial [Alphaproteobacteria bacterium]|nr:hypothetical protein [Alphaproteobacteria bacterium]